MDSIRCSDCDQTFCSKYNLLRHRRNKHSKVEIKSRSGELTDHLGAPGAPQEAHLGAPGAPQEAHLGAPGVPQGAHLGAPGAHLGAPGAHLGAPQGAPQGDILLPPPQGDLTSSTQQRKTYIQDGSSEKPTVLQHPFTMMVSGPTG